MLKNVFIVGAKRTAVASGGGKYTDISAIDLGVHSTKAAMKHAKITQDHVDHVIFGNVIPSSPDGIFLPRHILLKSGIPKDRPAYMVNRLCGAGFQSIVNASQHIMLGDDALIIAGGAENMTQVPFVLRGLRYEMAMGKKIELEDALWVTLTDTVAKMDMGETAENLGKIYKISREEIDKYAVRSQQLWKKAADAGIFVDEIEPMTLKTGEVFKVDNHPRPKTTLEILSKLKPMYPKVGNLITAGNSSGIADGAASVVICGTEALQKHDLTPMVRVAGYAIAAVDPTIMGIAPVYAIKKLLQKTKLTMDDIDLVDVNEAFAVQALAIQRELKIPEEKYNIYGGAIACGHPLGASGTRISVHLAHQLSKNPNMKYAIGSACTGGGQSVAILFERI